MKNIALKLSVIILLTIGSTCGASPYSNDNIHKWAQDIVFKYVPDMDCGGVLCGSYDTCLELRDGAKGPWISEPRQDLVNACAIIMDGAEW